MTAHRSSRRRWSDCARLLVRFTRWYGPRPPTSTESGASAISMDLFSVDEGGGDARRPDVGGVEGERVAVEDGQVGGAAGFEHARGGVVEPGRAGRVRGQDRAQADALAG